MNNPITVAGLVDYFENSLRRIDTQEYNSGGKEPYYPLLPVFIGQHGMSHFTALAERLCYQWPQYRNDFPFLGLELCCDSPKPLKLECKNGEISRTELSAEAVTDTVLGMYSPGSPFSSKNRLLLYFIADSDDYNSREAFIHCINALPQLKSMLGVYRTEVLSLFILFMNEKDLNGTVYKDIKDHLASYSETSPADVMSFLLLSNRLSNNTVLESREPCCRVAADVMALTDDSDFRFDTALFTRNDVFTLSFACEEKPAHEIAQTVVLELLRHFEGLSFRIRDKLSEASDFKSRLGLTPEGSLALLDDYAEKELSKLLPSENELELFPRRYKADCGSLYLLPERALNELTMDAWDCFLKEKVSKTQQAVAEDEAAQRVWSEQYAATLRRSFTVGELIWIKEHPEAVRECFFKVRVPSDLLPVSDAASARVKYLLSTDERLVDMFLKTAADCGERALEVEKSWLRLLRSQDDIHITSSRSVKEYYSGITRSFFDRYGTKLDAEFTKIPSSAALELFFKELIDKIIEYSDIFSVPFEEELQHRLSDSCEKQRDHLQYICQRLSGDAVPVYFQPRFNLGSPLASAVMLRTGTELHKSLRDSLPDTVYYYNTGRGSSAAAIELFRLNKENLIKEKGGIS